MTSEEAIKGLKSFVEVRRKYGDMQTMKDEIECLEMAIKALEQTRWIPVSERLPEVQKNGDKDFSDWVQVTIDISRNGDSDVYVCEAYYCFSENKWYTKRFVIGVVTAWMPLPKPYKAESEDKE